MLVDVKNRTSNAPVKIPPKYKAYVWQFSCIDSYECRVVIAESLTLASQYINDWCRSNGVDIFYSFLGEVDYEVAGEAGEGYFKELLFESCV